ncbi:MAG TPA: hypothetical protein VFU33_10735 [Gaiellaceae bacterium]|nr:hypothetical protein [Gaiellaceae bacterium]
MKRVLLLAISVSALAAATGCGEAHGTAADRAANARASIPADAPPSPATWPAYPRFSHHSCWARPFGKGVVHSVESNAPSYPPAPRAHPIPPKKIARRFLARFGDRRYLRSVTFSPAPPAVGRRVHVLYAGGHPPRDALEAHISVPAANERAEPRHPSHARNLTFGIADWESQLVGGALRDDFCAAGGAPLVFWSALPAGGGGIAESFTALEQRFPNPSPAAFRKRVALVGRRYGFRVVSLRLLRPEQIAPLLVVRTSRKRKEFVEDIPRIMDFLNPRSTAGKRSAETFEAFFFAAEDAHGPFTWTQYVSRGEGEGGQWAANQCLYPYPVIGQLVRPGSKHKSC